jgi:hypothetical protein
MLDLFIIAGVSIWLAGMALAIILPAKPSAVKIVEKLVCPRGSKMEVTTEVYSYHRPGQRAINVSCMDENGNTHNINGKAVFALFMLFFVIALPIATAAMLLIKNAIQSS